MIIMQANEYQELSYRTKSPSESHTEDLLHASLGLGTESGEFQDNIKRFFFYGKPLDNVNLIEELGDVLWYVALAASALGVTLEEVMQKNVDKLSARYPEKFTAEKAINRDVEKEREVLEKK